MTNLSKLYPVLFKPKPFLIYVGGTDVKTGTNPYVFDTVDFATDSDGQFPFPTFNQRTLVLAFAPEDSATNFSHTSVTVGGVAATEVIDSANGGSLVQAAIYAMDFPYTTLPDVTITMSEPVAGEFGCYAYLLHNLRSRTPISTVSSFRTSSALIDISHRTVAGGISIIASTCASSGQTVTEVGHTRVAQADGDVQTYSGFYLSPSDQPSHLTTLDWTGTADSIAVAAHFQ